MKATDFKRLLVYWAALMEENRNYLIDLDSVAGDGDLGLTMSDGFNAASQAVMEADETDIGKLSYLAGKAMSTAVPSTMGTLMASGFINAGRELKGRAELQLSGMADFFRAFFEGVQKRGKANVGDKTFLDGMYPAVQSLITDAEDGINICVAASKAADCALRAFHATKGMLAKHGRATVFGEKSRDILDPGAAVSNLLMKGYADFVEKNGKLET